MRDAMTPSPSAQHQKRLLSRHNTNLWILPLLSRIRAEGRHAETLLSEQCSLHKRVNTFVAQLRAPSRSIPVSSLSLDNREWITGLSGTAGVWDQATSSLTNCSNLLGFMVQYARKTARPEKVSCLLRGHQLLAYFQKYDENHQTNGSSAAQLNVVRQRDGQLSSAR